jgi:hypothetical protein
VAERVLLEQTLRGSLKALVDVLSLVSPAAFGRAGRIKERVAELAADVELPDACTIRSAPWASPVRSSSPRQATT